MTAQPAPSARRYHSRTFFVGLVIFVASLFSGYARAQSEDTPTPPINGIAHVAIRVHDLAASTAFYEKLGFEMSFDLRKDDIPYRSVLKINDRQFIELHAATAQDASIGFLHVCFEVGDLEAFRQDYLSRGITSKTVDKPASGDALFTIVGPVQPSGPQTIEFIQYMPGSLHSDDEGKHLDPDRVADKLVAVSLAMEDPDAARDFYINQLNFKPIAGDPMDLHMPGNSGQEIEIVHATLGAHARITLNSDNLGRSARHLHKEGVVAVKNGASLTIADPDGNIILLENR
jgi:predicted enzyme related to lactoylglutathione lyase